MNKTLKTVIAVVLVLLLSVFIVFEAMLILPHQFDQTYLAELADKYDRLREMDDENKIIIIGGSSVAFGINTPMMENALGMNVVNFGLYGPLGTVLMLDLTRGHINEGDIIVLSPETHEQTMSMYFNAEGFWDCCEADWTMLFKTRAHNWGDMIGSFWQFAQKKLQFFKVGKPATDGIYDHSSFNEYGDISYSRPESIMENWYDPEVLIDLDSSIVEQDFIDYVNDYIDYCESRGATVYWSWPPMNYLAVEQDYEGILAYATFIRENIHCQVISDISDYILNAGYFYDTNYHVTDRGSVVHTANLIQDLENFIGEGKKISISLPPPPTWNANRPSGEPAAGMPMPRGRTDMGGQPPVSPGGIITAQGWVEPAALPETETDVSAQEEVPAESAENAIEELPAEPEEEAVGSSRDAEYFLYESYDEGLLLTGTTEEGKQQTELEVPWLIDGQKVIALGENTFDGCNRLTAIYIQSNITRIMQHSFDGCSHLSEIHINNENGANILIPAIDLFQNVPDRVKVYVPQAYYGTYVADYFWGNYINRLKSE